MGTTFSGIHILSDKKIQISSFEFRSFSEGWQTCITDFSDKDIDYPFKAAKIISKQISEPILFYCIFDSDYIYFEFLQNGKCIARYSDDEFSTNKNLYGIPSILGYGDGYKKRLSNILSCDDAEEKNELLEEYFGVCLLAFPEFICDPLSLKREKSDALYREFRNRDQDISGKKAPVFLKLANEYKGKIFLDYFGSHTLTIKKHCYLFGYENQDSNLLTPVRFCGENLEPLSIEEFNQNRVKNAQERNFCKIEYGTICYAIFNDLAPSSYANKKMKLPNNFYPLGFDTKNRLVLTGRRKIYIADEHMKIVAKISIKGDCADMINDFILTTSGNSFFFYAYEPKAAVRIYQLVEK